VLPIPLRKLCFTALVRPHLEYCNLAFAGASKTNLIKLEIIQKIASRIICGVEKDAHAEPLLNKLGLSTLKERREKKILKTVNAILNGDCHPWLLDMFREDDYGLLTCNDTTRTTFGRKRFSFYARMLYNSFLLGSQD